MEHLFPIPPKSPEGFSYIPEFLSIAEEENLFQEISRVDLRTFIFHGYEAKRKVASFGYDYSFEKKTISKGQDIPQEFQWLIQKVHRYLNLQNNFAELLITQYPVGSVINWHRDAPPFDLIAGISICSDCLVRFRPHDKSKQGRKSILSIPVERRSLYIMQGPSRSDWEHSTMPVPAIRYSVTLRTLKDITLS
jgi:alkylated DNA repair dioxygenase AlkB